MPETILRADVCVVGAGPLGIAVASTLADAGLDVVQLESGGLDHSPEWDASGEVGSMRFGGVKSLGNTRQYGGNANSWQVRNGLTNRGVRLAPLTAADFEGHSGQPGSAWPFGLDALRAHLDRAQEFFALPRSSYDASDWADDDRADQVVDDPDVRTNVFQFADGAGLVSRSLRIARSHPRMRVVHNATALEVLTDDTAGRATGVRVAAAPGREFVVHAARVVLAAGTATSTQLLLASSAVRPAGLGNASDLVGRYFMDHLLLDGGQLWPGKRSDIDHRDLYDIRVVRGVPVLGHLELTDEALRAGGLLNLSLILLPRDDRTPIAPSPRRQAGIRAALTTRESLIRRTLPSREVLGDLVRGADGALARQLASLRHPEPSLGRGGWSRNRGSLAHRFSHFDVVHQAEQAPHADNRMVLSDDRDAFGRRKLAVDWRWHSEDAAATVRAQETYARALKRAGWGEFRIAGTEDGRPIVHSHSSNHFMGTTRMNASSRHGVVDTRGAVHGTPNLYVASSSVFPSGGFANVTLTAVAVAFKIADAIISDAGTTTTLAQSAPSLAG